MTRFAIVSPNFFPQTCGVGDHSVRLAQELRRRGFEAAVFSRDPVAPNPVAPDVPVKGVAGSRPDVIGRRLTEAILATRPTDVIVQYTSQMWNTWRFGSAALPRLAAAVRRTGARVTLIAHELYVGFSRRPDLTVASALQRAQLAVLLTQCARSFVTTGTRLQYIAPYCALLGRPAPGVLRIGPNALPFQAPRRNAGTRVGVFSTAGIGKRLDLALDAFSRIAREVPSAKLVIIGHLGPPDAPHVREVTDAVERHEARDRIRLTGKLPLDEIAREVSELDLYLFPGNTGANTRSGTLPVALGAGLPIVAFNGPETDLSLFHDGGNISLVSTLTADAFAEAAVRLLHDAPSAKRLGAAARDLYDQHMRWERITDHLLRELGIPSTAEGSSAEQGDRRT